MSKAPAAHFTRTRNSFFDYGARAITWSTYVKTIACEQEGDKDLLRIDSVLGHKAAKLGHFVALK